jgi:hypothetical protein
MIIYREIAFWLLNIILFITALNFLGGIIIYIILRLKK